MLNDDEEGAPVEVGTQQQEQTLIDVRAILEFSVRSEKILTPLVRDCNFVLHNDTSLWHVSTVETELASSTLTDINRIKLEMYLPELRFTLTDTDRICKFTTGASVAIHTQTPNR